MSSTITADVSAMFATIEPWDTSNSVANLGPHAGELTWGNALAIASRVNDWLISPSLPEAAELMRDWAISAGMDRDEVVLWADEYAIGILAQNIASELQMLDRDNEGSDLDACVDRCANTDWDKESEYPVGSYYHAPNGAVHVEYYTGI